MLGESKTLAWGFAMAPHRLHALVLYLISGCLWKGKNSKNFSLYAFTAEQEWISAKYENVVKNFLTIISNYQGFKIDEVNCREQSGVTYPGIFCKSNSSKKSY